MIVEREIFRIRSRVNNGEKNYLLTMENLWRTANIEKY